MGEKLNSFYWIRIYIVSSIFFLNFKFCTAQETLFDTLLNKNVLIGNVDFGHIQDSLWFKEYLHLHSLEIEKIDELFIASKLGNKSIEASKEIEFMTLLEDVTLVEVYFGSWCSDSHNWLPYFYLLSKVFMFQDKVQLIGIPKTQNYRDIKYPDKNIEKVPTFIVYRQDIEMGRIVENPDNIFFDDFFSILKK